jgi:predicted Zn-dependent protease
LQPELPWPHFIAGKALLETGHAKEAALALERSLGTNPFDPTVHCTLAEAYEKLPASPTVTARRERAARHCKELSGPEQH